MHYTRMTDNRILHNKLLNNTQIHRHKLYKPHQALLEYIFLYMIPMLLLEAAVGNNMHLRHYRHLPIRQTVPTKCLQALSSRNICRRL